MGATPEAVVDEFIAKVTSDDLDGAMELLADDVEYDNVPMGKNHGRDATRTFLEQMAGLDEIEFVILNQTATGNVVMNERVDRFRLGEKWMDLPVAGVFVVNDDGLITLWRDYFDLATMTNQMAELAG
jgi:limonene-1,2-epoxide hydrolase